ncbi:hypothetical protein JTB14_034992 [Gonioctena quinquepunctata]|nr:hypothetical protein JTB14_034992 [Gonioctena quinquepunctata]
MYGRGDRHQGGSRRHMRAEVVARWQQEWNAEIRKAQWTRRLIPDVVAWLGCEYTCTAMDILTTQNTRCSNARNSKASDCNKRKKTQELRQNYPANELSYAAQMSLRSDGRIEASKVFEDKTNISPGRAERYRKAFIEMEDKKLGSMTEEEALSIIIETKLSRHQYEVIRCE